MTEATDVAAAWRARALEAEARELELRADLERLRDRYRQHLEAADIERQSYERRLAELLDPIIVQTARKHAPECACPVCHRAALRGKE